MRRLKSFHSRLFMDIAPTLATTALIMSLAALRRPDRASDTKNLNGPTLIVM
ncbi:hypothetical protein [Acetobacter nitrogenifigens]|uniref:hypothetical protein n=1 Tax=Acetobacter nitrogenifigens TaxID=285268 RepID=UPI0004257FB9|nr:hypothetical protein [Acetobacter nitrogenifigens]